jgi:uncharacterized protein (TIGR00730 family)
MHVYLLFYKGIRIKIAELVNLMTRKINICVFCGSREGNNQAFRSTAIETGNHIGKRGWRLIYGGGGVGLMGLVANSTMEAGGDALGIIPEFLSLREAGHTDLDDLIVTSGMHDRKQIMYSFADAFIALPGGVGTLDETIEILTWKQLERHKKPIILIDTNNFWKTFLAVLENSVETGFMDKSIYELLEIAPDVETAFKIIESHI